MHPLNISLNFQNGKGYVYEEKEEPIGNKKNIKNKNFYATDRRVCVAIRLVTFKSFLSTDEITYNISVENNSKFNLLTAKKKTSISRNIHSGENFGHTNDIMVVKF